MEKPSGNEAVARIIEVGEHSPDTLEIFRAIKRADYTQEKASGKRDPLIDPQMGDVILVHWKFFGGKPDTREVLARCGNAVAVRELRSSVVWIPLDCWCQPSSNIASYEVVHAS